MADLPNLDAARAALAATLLPASTFTTYRAIGECGHDLGYSSPTDNYPRRHPLWCSDCGDYAGIDEVRAVEMVNHSDTTVDAAHLRDALAAVDILTAELAALKEREGRLTDILAAERGERAPEGWRWEDGEWSRGELSVVPGPTGTGWFWGRTRRGSFYAEVHHAYALKAIEAADRAVTEVARG